MAAAEFIINAIAGTIGGVAGVYVGSPLDVLKTRMQTGALGTHGLWASIATTLKEHGFKSLFRGSVVSSLGQAPNNFITFGAYGGTLSLLTSARERRGVAPSSPSLPPLIDVYLAGTSAGLLQTVALTPCELIKVQQQMFTAGADGKPVGMLECTRLVLSSHGVTGLYRGWVSTVVRDAGTYGAYFGLYDAMRRKLGVFNPRTGDVDAPAWVLLLSGGLAGAASWLLALPADVIKSVIQAAPLDVDARAHEGEGCGRGKAGTGPTMRSVAAAIYARDGIRGFYRGLLPCMLRALPVNAVTFYGYESTLAWLGAERDEPGESTQVRAP